MAFVISRDGVRIAYEVFGDEGPWVVLLQGLGLSSRFWGDVPQSLLPPHAGPQRVLLVDNRGTGRSERRPAPFSIEDLADDVAAAMDAAGVQRAIVCGISMGGMIAQHVAVRHPLRCEGLVLLATTPGLPWGIPPGPVAIGRLASLPLRIRMGATEAAYTSLFFGTRPPEEAKRLTTKLLGTWKPLIATERAAGSAFALQLFAAARHSSNSSLGRFTGPVHVVHGDRDAVIPPGNAERLKQLVPHASLEVLPGVGHAIPVEDPLVVQRSVARVRAALA